MNATIIEAHMSWSKEEGYTGQVKFTIEGHSRAYEITLQKKRGNDWMYGLLFADGMGKEEEIMLLEEQLEENDELFDTLVEAAKSTLEKE
ncbi:hypothetical protein ACFOQM_22790 [Paenibacillus sp. GCM10012307]|uniref:Uncharacterized protein n=1 Tax=Paenibacillus roseus TaxID=2798579 RepID=A0A934JBK8_9BACL|nr:hypothetical protein [Paenibacillus roseus]MBJ6364057.1 hypothetical protein [Paenibacillus roseus]